MGKTRKERFLPGCSSTNGVLIQIIRIHSQLIKPRAKIIETESKEQRTDRRLYCQQLTKSHLDLSIYVVLLVL